MIIWMCRRASTFLGVHHTSLLGKLELAKFSGDLYPTIANYTQKMPRLAEALKILVL